MYMLLPEICFSRSNETREVAEVVGQDEDLLLSCSEPGLITDSLVGLLLLIGTICENSTVRRLDVWISTGWPRALVRFFTRTSVGWVKLRSHWGAEVFPTSIFFTPVTRITSKR